MVGGGGGGGGGRSGNSQPPRPSHPVILLDTNALLWLQTGHSRARLLAKQTRRLYVSPASLLELQFLIELGRIRLRAHLAARARAATIAGRQCTVNELELMVVAGRWMRHGTGHQDRADGQAAVGIAGDRFAAVGGIDSARAGGAAEQRGCVWRCRRRPRGAIGGRRGFWARRARTASMDAVLATRAMAWHEAPSHKMRRSRSLAMPHLRSLLACALGATEADRVPRDTRGGSHR